MAANDNEKPVSRKPGQDDDGNKPVDLRRRRQAEALRANLRKRKEQARSRMRDDGGPQNDDDG